MKERIQKYIQLIYAYYLKTLKKRKSRQGNDHSSNLLLMKMIIWTLIWDQKIEELLIHSDREQLQHNLRPQQNEGTSLVKNFSWNIIILNHHRFWEKLWFKYAKISSICQIQFKLLSLIILLHSNRGKLELSV